VRSDLSQSTHRLKEEDTLGDILFLRLKVRVKEGLPVTEDLLGNLKL
jgi:hypothetical protein